MNIPEEYEAYKMNCTAGDAVVGILCRRPDGGVSDWHSRMNKVAINAVCPACGRDMKKVRTGTFSCKTGHLLVVMTNTEASKAHFGKGKATPQIVSKLPAKRTVTYKQPAQRAFPPSITRKELPTVSIQDQVAKALKEAGL